VKLFDFGLATVMPPHGDPYEDRFVMSGAGEATSRPTNGQVMFVFSYYIYLDLRPYRFYCSFFIPSGSPRYMAPEVLVDPPDKYNFKADVYSFGIVLWEILSLETPFSHVRSKSDLVEFVGEHNIHAVIS
jgi:serine/threonine protein kinase